MESKVLRYLWFLGGLMLAPMAGLQAFHLGDYADTTIGSNCGYDYSFIATAADGTDSINFDNLIHVDGYTVIGAYNGATMNVAIGSGIATNATVFRTALSNEGACDGDQSNVIFYAEEGGVLNINVSRDCYFTSGLYVGDSSNFANAKNSYQPSDSYQQTVTFSGAGVINITLADGVTFAFDSLFPVSGGSINANSMAFELNDGTVDYTIGTLAYILMDQTATQAITNKENKVTFERVSVDSNDDVTIRIGCDSTITYLSTDRFGTDADQNGTLAFDISNRGCGRMKLDIAGGNTNAYHDGAFLVYGHWYDADYDYPWGYMGGCGDCFYTGYVELRTFAGYQAIVRVIDTISQEDSAYTEFLFIDSENKNPYYNDSNVDDLSRRGLLIVNDCRSTNPFAANTFGDFGYVDGSAFKSRNSQVGCVLGVNGVMEANHNTFYDYIATSTPIPYSPCDIELDTTTGYSTNGMNLYNLCNNASPLGSSWFKARSPGALLVDGLDFSGSVISGNFSNGNVRPTINLYGQSAFYVRGGVEAGGEVNSDYTLDNWGEYDGDVLNSPDLLLQDDGMMVLDVEGELVFQHLQDETYDPDNIGQGRLNIPSIQLDHAGREIYYLCDDSFITRPLNLGSNYPVYQRSYIFANNDIQFVGTTLDHNDVLHLVAPNPLFAQPAIMGGEAATWYDDIEQLPFFHLSNARVECHESLCSTGVRWLVHDSFGPDFNAPSFTNNSCPIVCYNQGDGNDTYFRNYGRVFALGSALNTLHADPISNSFLDSAYLNIFRDWDNFDEGGAPAQCVLDIAPQSEYQWGGNGDIVDGTQQATQVVMLGNDSNITIGWHDTIGFYRYQDSYPWNDNGGDSFSNDANSQQPAELLINGNNFYFFGEDRNGDAAPFFTNDFEAPGVLYVNRGGLLTVQSTIEQPYGEGFKFPHVFFDVPVATLLWPSDDGLLYGQTFLPEDQIKFGSGYGVEPYQIVMDDIGDPNVDVGPMFNQKLTEVVFSWGDVNLIDSSFVPVKSDIADLDIDGKRAPKVRSTVPVTSPVTLPGAIMTVGAGYYADQYQVAGATSASPFHFYFSGDDTGYSQVREIVSVPSFPVPIFGEGMFGALFLDQGARLGLGSRSWNDKSNATAWNMLGENWVTLYPNGDCVIDVNSDLIVRDLNAIIPTTNFGNVPDGQAHRITFISQDTREIRIPAGGELDLSAFGQPTLDDGNTGFDAQQICFAGKTRLVFEPGSTLRFPSLIFFEEDDVLRSPILYMNEDSEIVFETVKDRNKPMPETLEELDRYRVKIKGVGRIWLNKNAKMLISDEAMVGVETDDDRSPQTFLQISIQREGQLLIGDENTKGGSFQVGNPRFQGDEFENFIFFQLRLAGSGALFNIDRYGFFGLGAGIFSQERDQVNSWQLVALNNLAISEIRVIDGTFSHNQIYDGGIVEGSGDAESDGSLMAIGPTIGFYLMEIGPKTADRQPIVRGGGNLVYVTDEAQYFDPLNLAFNPILSTQIELEDDSFYDNGKYSILGSTPMTFQKTSVQSGDAEIGTIDSPFSFFPPIDPDLIGGQVCFANQAGFYQYLSSLSTRFQEPAAFACFGVNNGQRRVGYVEGDFDADDNIIRKPLISLLSDNDIDQADRFGVLIGSARRADGDCAAFTAQRQQ